MDGEVLIAVNRNAHLWRTLYRAMGMSKGGIAQGEVFVTTKEASVNASLDFMGRLATSKPFLYNFF